MPYASDIGKLQIARTSKLNLAAHYRRMALAIAAGTLDRHTFPKAVPRGKPVEWYLARADVLEQQAQTAGELADALVDLNHQRWLETVTPEVALDTIERHIALLEHLTDGWRQDWPQLTAKLTTDQREAFSSRVRQQAQRLITALRGGR